METTAAEQPKKRSGLNIFLWFVQGLLAIAFLGAGFMKVSTPYEQLVSNPEAAWVRNFSAGFLKFIGVAEILGAIGLLVPSLTRIQPRLTPLAAAGLVLIMMGAAVTHIRQGESFIPNLVLATLAVVVIWGRWKKAPIAPRA